MIPEENQELLKQILMKERTITQKEAGRLLNLSPAQISHLVKKEKIKADEEKRPFLKSVIDYTPTPTKKRKHKKKEEK